MLLMVKSFITGEAKLLNFRVQADGTGNIRKQELFQASVALKVVC
ncbi:hypothetical protein AAZX31_03G021900 [Glycine max]